MCLLKVTATKLEVSYCTKVLPLVTPDGMMQYDNNTYTTYAFPKATIP